MILLESRSSAGTEQLVRGGQGFFVRTTSTVFLNVPPASGLTAIRSLTARRWRRWSARRAARLTRRANEVLPVPVECFFSAPTFTSRAREASALFGTSAVTAIADGPAGVVTLPRTIDTALPVSHLHGRWAELPAGRTTAAGRLPAGVRGRRVRAGRRRVRVRHLDRASHELPCSSQWNAYVPYASNVQLPLHADGLAVAGMSVHEVG